MDKEVAPYSCVYLGRKTRYQLVVFMLRAISLHSGGRQINMPPTTPPLSTSTLTADTCVVCLAADSPHLRITELIQLSQLPGTLRNGVPPILGLRRNKSFVGQERLIEQLSDLIIRSYGTCIAISGLGGSGLVRLCKLCFYVLIPV